MTDHNPMPVAGYTAQSQSNDPDTDKRCVALGVTNMQMAAMWAVRSIFKPQRIKLPEDGA